MDKVSFIDLFRFMPKSKVKAGEGLEDGLYPFFTSSGELTKRIDNYLFDNESLIFGTGGSASIHFCNGQFSVSTDCFVTQPIDGTVNSKFYYYYLFGNIHVLERGFKGAGLKHISKDYLSNLKIPYIPKEQQDIIVEILDKAHALVELDKQIIQKYDQLAQSVFLEMFGDPVTNPKGWKVETIENLVKKEKHSLKRGPFGGALKKEIFVEKGYLVYEQYHALNKDFSFARYYIDELKFSEMKPFEVRPGDIIISCSGVNLGKLAIVPSNAKRGIINQALLKITLDKAKMFNEFYLFIFTSKNFKAKFFGNNIGSGIPNFPPMSTFKKFGFICPPIKLQKKFNDIIKNIEQQKQIAKKSLKKSEELFQSLLQKAFKGELIKEQNE